MKAAQFYFLALFLIVLAASCSKDEGNTAGNQGSVTLVINPVVGVEPLALNTGAYTNAAQEAYTVSLFKFYLSNINLTADGGTNYAPANNYHIIDQEVAASNIIKLVNLPAGRYDTLIFSVGVDSLHNHSGAQTGALAPDMGMFWYWNIGYKFLMLEGTSPASPAGGNVYLYHAGLDEAYRTIKIPLPAPINVKAGSAITITLSADIQILFGAGGDTISIAANYNEQGFSPVNKQLANNYAQMFTLSSVTGQ